MGCDRAGPKMTELDGLDCNYFLELCRNVTEIFYFIFLENLDILMMMECCDLDLRKSV